MYNFPLMHNNFEKSDFTKVISLLKKKNPILTQSKNVKKFEKEWSKWLGVKYSIFVNSGSSANLITLSALRIILNKKKREIIVPSFTWMSDIISIIKNDFKPIFVDINLQNLYGSKEEILKKININTAAVFLTHAQGFNGLSTKLLKILKKKKIPLIEDVCESHGAKFGKKKLGTFGIASNFSFYYAHHMSTIEGGMISTNNKKIYEMIRVLRSHGMAREIGNSQLEKKIIKKNPNLSPKFIFLHPGYNFRNNEIGAIIGLNQLKRLNKNVIKRKENLIYFLNLLSEKFYLTNFDINGNSNYAFPLILKKKNFGNRDLLEKILDKNRIEYRRGSVGGGNQLRQPYLKNFLPKINFKNFKNVEHVHNFGYYLGNYPSLPKSKIKILCNILNRIDFK